MILCSLVIPLNSEEVWLQGFASKEIYVVKLDNPEYDSPLSSITFEKIRSCFVSVPANACKISIEK